VSLTTNDFSLTAHPELVEEFF